MLFLREKNVRWRAVRRKARVLVLRAGALGPRLIDQATDPVQARDRERDAGIRKRLLATQRPADAEGEPLSYGRIARGARSAI